MNLSNCPWCESDHIWEGEASTEIFNVGFYAECQNCGFQMQGPTRASVEEPWNRASATVNTEAE